MEKARGVVMVALPLEAAPLTPEQEAAPPPFKHTSVCILEVIEKGYRLEASAFDIESRQARQDIENCKHPVVNLGDEFIEKAFYLERFKRIYVDKKYGIPFILPSQITDIYPKAVKFISHQTAVNIASTKVKAGQILLTRSGRVGTVSYASKALKDKSLSDDVIRLEALDYSGYVYAYLKSRIGKLLVETNSYGAVITHIEPEHLNNIPIPNPPPILKQEIHDTIEASFRLRDESNARMDAAQALLKDALRLPDIDALQANAPQYDPSAAIQNCTVAVDDLNDRLDASYHTPIVQAIEQHLHTHAREVTTVGDRRVSQAVILPGRFKRAYVEAGNGVVFFGGKQIFELDPSNKKHLSLTQHGDRIKKQLKLHTNMTLITCSGTIGKVNIVPQHWEGWTANQHIIRVVPADHDIAGYLYAWLSSDYGYALITRHTYGAVVDEISDKQVAAIRLPFCHDEPAQKEINRMVLEANQQRAEAYALEQKALNILDDKVIYAR